MAPPVVADRPGNGNEQEAGIDDFHPGDEPFNGTCDGFKGKQLGRMVLFEAGPPRTKYFSLRTAHAEPDPGIPGKLIEGHHPGGRRPVDDQTRPILRRVRPA